MKKNSVARNLNMASQTVDTDRNEIGTEKIPVKTISIKLEQTERDVFDEKGCAGCRMYDLCKFVAENGLDRQSGAMTLAPTGFEAVDPCNGCDGCRGSSKTFHQDPGDGVNGPAIDRISESGSLEDGEDLESLGRWADSAADAVSRITGYEKVLVYAVFWSMMRLSNEKDFWDRIVGQAAAQTGISEHIVLTIITTFLELNEQGECDGRES